MEVWQNGIAEMRNCKVCSKKIYSQNVTGYCLKCHTNINLTEKFNNWLNTGDLGIKTGTTLRYGMRELLLNYYGRNCYICKIDTWNGKPLVLILDHINGDASNNNKENLRFVCPNCDSQLDTYKSKNKNSARNHRRINNGR